MLSTTLYPKTSFPLLSFFLSLKGVITSFWTSAGLGVIPPIHRDPKLLVHWSVFSQDLWKSVLPWDWIGPLFSSTLNKQRIFIFNRNGNVFPCSWTTEKSISSVFSVTALLKQLWMLSIPFWHYWKNLEYVVKANAPHHSKAVFPCFPVSEQLWLGTGDGAVWVKYLKLRMWRGSVVTGLSRRQHY